MRYLRMLTNSMIGGLAFALSLTILVLQINPRYPLMGIPGLTATLILSYGFHAATVFYALLVLRQVLATEVISPGWISFRFLVWLCSASAGIATLLTWVNLRELASFMDPEAVTRMTGGAVVLTVCFGASDGTKLSKGIRLEAMRLIERFAKDNWLRLRDEPEHAKILRFESGCVTISLGEPVSAAMAGLNRLRDALRRIVEDPEIRGGLPVVRGTRISVYEIADAVSSDGIKIALEDFPALSREDVEAAMLYATAHPRTGRPRANSSPRRPVSEETVDLTDKA